MVNHIRTLLPQKSTCQMAQFSSLLPSGWWKWDWGLTVQHCSSLAPPGKWDYVHFRRMCKMWTVHKMGEGDKASEAPRKKWG